MEEHHKFVLTSKDDCFYGGLDLRLAIINEDENEVIKLLDAGYNPNKIGYDYINSWEEAEQRSKINLINLMSTRFSRDLRIWDISDVTCQICHCILFNSITINSCKHNFCRSCIQLARQSCNECPTCKKGIEISSYRINKVLESILYTKFPVEYEKSRIDSILNPIENAISNLFELSEGLELDLTYNSNGVCVLKIDGEFAMHLTYNHLVTKIFIYGTLLENVSNLSDEIKIIIFDELLIEGIHNDAFSGGSFGYISSCDLLEYHLDIPMIKAPNFILKVKTIDFVKKIKYWTNRIQEIISLNNNSEENLTITEISNKRKQKLNGITNSINLVSNELDQLSNHNVDSCINEKLIQVIPKEQAFQNSIGELSFDSTFTACLQLIKLNINELRKCNNPNENFDSWELHFPIQIGGITFLFEPKHGRLILEVAILKNIPYSVSPNILSPILGLLLQGASFGTRMLYGGIRYRKETHNTFQIVVYSPLNIVEITNEFSLVNFVSKFKVMVEDWMVKVTEKCVKPKPQ